MALRLKFVARAHEANPIGKAKGFVVRMQGAALDGSAWRDVSVLVWFEDGDALASCDVRAEPAMMSQGGRLVEVESVRECVAFQRFAIDAVRESVGGVR